MAMMNRFFGGVSLFALVILFTAGTVSARCDHVDKCNGDRLFIVAGVPFEDSCGKFWEANTECELKRVCFDLTDDCPSLARQGKCGQASVKEQCQVSCKVCAEKMPEKKEEAPLDPVPDTICEDIHRNCRQRARDGKCASEWVQQNCRLTCGMCTMEKPAEMVIPNVAEQVMKMTSSR